MEPLGQYQRYFDPSVLTIDRYRDEVRAGRVVRVDEPELTPYGMARPENYLVYCYQCGELVELPRPHQRRASWDIVLRNVPKLRNEELPTCPNGHEQLLGRERNRDVHIALIGLTGVAKTTYLAALYDAIVRRRALRPFGFEAVMPSEWRKAFTKNVYNEIFEYKLAVQPNATDEEDISKPYEQVLGIELMHHADERLSVNLMFIDVAGERLSFDMVHTAPHVLRTHAAIFFVDPASLEMPNRPATLPFELEHASWVDAVRHSDPDVSPSLTYPVCVAVTKADQLTGAVDQHLLTDRSPDRNSYYDLLVDSCLTQDVLEAFGGRQYMESVESVFETARGHQGVTYHTFAPTGHSAQGGGEGVAAHYAEVKPFRCLDPVLSILYRKRRLPMQDAPSKDAIQPRDQLADVYAGGSREERDAGANDRQDEPGTASLDDGDGGWTPERTRRWRRRR